MSKLIVVIGATGKQGGSVLASLLADSSASQQFKYRGVTRDTSKPAAQALAKQGVEMVAADLDDKASLVKAFQGAYGVFAVTDFWATMDKGVEVQQGKNLADAAKETGVEHYVFSSLIDTLKSTGGKLTKIDHFDSKAEIAEYTKSIGVPTTLYLPGFYNTNLPGYALVKTDNSYILALPCDEDAQIPLIDIEADTGKYVKAIFLNKEKTLGKDIYGSEKYYTPKEITSIFEKTFPNDGKGIQFVKVEGGDYVAKLQSFGMPQRIGEELLENMYLLNKEFGYYAGADLAESNALLNEPATTFEEYLRKEPQFAELK